jgi:hypothetical protein
MIGCKYDFKEKTNTNEFSKKEERLQEVERIFQNKFFDEKRNENLQLDESLKLLSINKDTVLAKDVLKNKLVFRYSQSNCRLCIDSEIDLLIKNSTLITNEICVVASYDRFRGVIVDKRKFVQNGLKNVKIYWAQRNINIPVEKENVPYYFYLNSDFTLSNIFIPIKEYPKLSQGYLKFTLKNFFINR